MFKKVCAFIIVVFLLACLCSCSNENNSTGEKTNGKEELTFFEKEIVGEWILDDAKIKTGNIGDYNYYPNGPQGFNFVVSEYYNKATLVFYDEKADGKIKGELRTSNGNEVFYWTRSAKKVINITSYIHLDYWSSQTDSKRSNTLINTLYLSDDCSYIDIMFGSAEVFYYFDKK